jgi:hypothetical protein
MQGREKRDYRWRHDAEKEAKKQAKFWPYSWVIQHPLTGRYVVLTGETIDDAPTRVAPLAAFGSGPPLSPCEPDDGELWRMLVSLIDGGHIVISLKDHGVINSTDLADIVRDEASNV